MFLVLVALCEVLWLLAVVLLACLLEPLWDCNISFGKRELVVLLLYIYIFFSFLFSLIAYLVRIRGSDVLCLYFK